MSQEFLTGRVLRRDTSPGGWAVVVVEVDGAERGVLDVYNLPDSCAGHMVTFVRRLDHLNPEAGRSYNCGTCSGAAVADYERRSLEAW